MGEIPDDDQKNTSIKSLLEYHEKCFDIFKNKGLVHMIHINARFLLPKLSEIRLLATRTKAAVISITESWLDESVTNAEFKINDYRVVRSDRNRHGGGICTFVRSDIVFSPRNDLH